MRMGVRWRCGVRGRRAEEKKGGVEAAFPCPVFLLPYLSRRAGQRQGRKRG